MWKTMDGILVEPGKSLKLGLPLQDRIMRLSKTTGQKTSARLFLRCAKSGSITTSSRPALPQPPSLCRHNWLLRFVTKSNPMHNAFYSCFLRFFDEFVFSSLCIGTTGLFFFFTAFVPPGRRGRRRRRRWKGEDLVLDEWKTWRAWSLWKNFLMESEEFGGVCENGLNMLFFGKKSGKVSQKVNIFTKG